MNSPDRQVTVGAKASSSVISILLREISTSASMTPAVHGSS